MPTRLGRPENTARSPKTPGTDRLAHLRTALHLARTEQNLTQRALAAKLGIGQRQISDLERATVDVRLSTLENVARALGLELMLIPRPLISTVEAISRTGTGEPGRPLYALDDDEGPDDVGTDR
jgi:HTH-type transcriptional regulator/antitoxin HipB